MPLVSYLAVGRLLKSQDIHVVIADQRVDVKANSTAYERHVQTIMNRGADKLKPGGKIKLTSENDDYDLHLMCDVLSGDDRVVFFIVADTKFGPIGTMFDDFKRQFYQANSILDIQKCKKYGGSVHKNSQSLMKNLLQQYSSTKLLDVQAKVNEVATVMEKNVYTALQNVEKVETLENKSAILSDSANQFQKGATEVKKQMRCKYIRVTALLFLVIAIIITIVVVSVTKGSGSDDDKK